MNRMNRYWVETDENGGVRVWVAAPGDDAGQIADSFPTRREAEAWINEQLQIAIRSANASDVA